MVARCKESQVRVDRDMVHKSREWLVDKEVLLDFFDRLTTRGAGRTKSATGSRGWWRWPARRTRGPGRARRWPTRGPRSATPPTPPTSPARSATCTSRRSISLSNTRLLVKNILLKGQVTKVILAKIILMKVDGARVLLAKGILVMMVMVFLCNDRYWSNTSDAVRFIYSRSNLAICNINSSPSITATLMDSRNSRVTTMVRHIHMAMAVDIHNRRATALGICSNMATPTGIPSNMATPPGIPSNMAIIMQTATVKYIKVEVISKSYSHKMFNANLYF